MFYPDKLLRTLQRRVKVWRHEKRARSAPQLPMTMPIPSCNPRRNGVRLRSDRPTAVKRATVLASSERRRHPRHARTRRLPWLRVTPSSRALVARRGPCNTRSGRKAGSLIKQKSRSCATAARQADSAVSTMTRTYSCQTGNYVQSRIPTVGRLTKHSSAGEHSDEATPGPLGNTPWMRQYDRPSELSRKTAGGLDGKLGDSQKKADAIMYSFCCRRPSDSIGDTGVRRFVTGPGR